jgi:hypothetical protein
MEKMSGQPGRQFFRRPLYRLKPRQESGETAFLFLFSDYFASSAKKQGGRMTAPACGGCAESSKIT